MQDMPADMPEAAPESQATFEAVAKAIGGDTAAAFDGDISAPSASLDSSEDAAENAARRKLAAGISFVPLTGGDSAPAIGKDPSGAGRAATAAAPPPPDTDAARPPADQAAGRAGLSSVFEHVELLHRDIERSKTTIAQRTAALAVERDAHHEVKTRYRLLYGEHERVTGELASIQAELERQSAMASDLETTIALLQQSLLDKSKEAAEHARRAETELQTQSDLRAELHSGKAELGSAEEHLIQFETDLALAREATAAARGETRKRDEDIADLRARQDRISRLQDETRAELEASRKQTESAESATAQVREELARQRSALKSEIDGRRGDLAAGQIKMDSVLARAETLERGNADLLAELGGRTEEVRLLETFLREQQASASQAHEALDLAEQEAVELRGRNRELEAANSALAEHAEGLAKSLRAREKEGGNWKQKVDGANERLRIEAQRFEADRESMGQTIARLTARLEEEKTARAVNEAALDAARRERQVQSRSQVSLRLVASQDAAAPMTGTHGKGPA